MNAVLGHPPMLQRPTDVVLRRLEAEADELWSFVVRCIGLVRERG